MSFLAIVHTVVYCAVTKLRIPEHSKECRTRIKLPTCQHGKRMWAILKLNCTITELQSLLALVGNSIWNAKYLRNFRCKMADMRTACF